MTVSFFSPYSVASADAAGCQLQAVVLGERGARRRARASAGACGTAGRPAARGPTAHRHRPRGRSRRAPAAPAPPAAAAMPSSSARSPSFDEPYTASSAPALCVRKLRRERPVPAGSGMPGSIAGSPRPASAAARCRSRERERPVQWLQSLMPPASPVRSRSVGGARSGSSPRTACASRQRRRRHRAPSARTSRSARCVASPSGGWFQNSSAPSSSFWRRTAARPCRGSSAYGFKHIRRDPPASAPRRRVEPARVVPPGDVRRIEELLSRHRAEPCVRGRVDATAESAQQPGVVDRRRLHHARAVYSAGCLRIAATTGFTRLPPARYTC